MAQNIRFLAYQCLTQKESPVPFPQILETCYQKLEQNGHAKQEKARIMSLCYGVMRNAGLLRAVSQDYAKKPFPKNTEICLHMALLEIFFLSGQEHACVNEYVELAKKTADRQKANALNAVLRAVLKNKEAVGAKLARLMREVCTEIPGNQTPNKKQLRKLHQLADLPEIFTAETDRPFIQKIAEESFSAPVPAYRLNLTQPPAELPPDCMRISPSIVLDPQNSLSASAERGLATRQGVGSALLAEKILEFCPKKENVTFWDMCAGRGGKSLALLEKGFPVTLCTEPNGQRLEEFGRQLERLKLRSPVLLRGTAQEAMEHSEKREFSHILLDSPCTTSGTIARNPEVKHRITAETLAEILKTQSALLELAQKHLMPKGLLFYCTCSVFACENKGQIKKFLQNCPDMQCLHSEYIVPSQLSPRLKGHDILFWAVLQKM